MTLTWCRQIGCGLPMVLYFIWRRADWRGLRDRQLLKLLAVCVVGLGGNALLFNIGLQYATPSATQVMGQLGPVLMLLGAVFIFKESFTRQQWLGAAAIMAGLLLFFHDRLGDLVGMTAYGIGMVILAIAPLFWASYALAQKRLSGRLGTQQVLVVAYVIGTFVFLPMAKPGAVAGLGPVGWLLLVGLIGLYMASYITLGGAMARWEASRVSAMITLTPLFTLGFSQMVVLVAPGAITVERTDLLSLLGALMVVGGSLLIALPRRRYA
jgi:drug/metabolite transporter (DMT)-like permease